MASLDYRLNPLFTIKECSSCGSLYNKGYCCTPDSSQQPPQDCVKCGNPVEGPNCQGCALWRKKLNEVWFTICHENGIYQDLLNTYESSDDETNVVNAPREPFVVKQDPDVYSSQSPPLIDHHCCYECGDSLDDIFCQQCTFKLCKRRKKKSELWKTKRLKIDIGRFPFATMMTRTAIAITPVLPTEEPVNSLSMGDELLDTIPATESDKVIKSSVEELVLILSESEGISDSVCDVPLCDNPTPKKAFKDHSKIVIDSNDDDTSSDDDDFEDIEYIEASPPDLEIVSLEEVNDVDQENEEFDLENILLI
ncbi:hypothetical protein Tco_1577805 [Tanacetum coccineum]